MKNTPNQIKKNYSKNQNVNIFPHKYEGKSVRLKKNIVTALIYFCSYPYGTPCTPILKNPRNTYFML